MNKNFNKDNNETPLTDIDYEGVIYEPSENIKNNNNNNNINKINNKNINDNKPKPKIKKAPNFNFSLFMGITIAIGVIIFGIVAMLTYSSLSSYISLPSTEDKNLTTSNQNIEDSLALDSNTNKNIVGVIKSINYEKNIFTFSSLNTNKIYTLRSKPSSIFKDKYDNMLTISELHIGDLVDFSFDDDNKINYIYENKDSFLLENVSNVKINSDLNVLTLNDKTFKISDKISILKNNEPYDLANVSPLDVLDIKGYKNTIYFMEIKKGNGILKLENKPDLDNAVIEIDRDIFKSLDEIDKIQLSEGNHKIVIRSEDTLSFVKEINIISGQETILDLNQIQNKSGTLFIQSNVDDYTLYINNVIETSREPLKLQYGAYTIRAEKEGYSPFTAQISINSPQSSVDINLEKIEKMGEINISSSPDGAEVFINNALVGYTPLKYKLPQGVHTIVLKKDGYNDFVLSSVTIGEEDSSFNITMHKNVEEKEKTTETTLAEPTI